MNTHPEECRLNEPRLLSFAEDNDIDPKHRRRAVYWSKGLFDEKGRAIYSLQCLDNHYLKGEANG